MSEHSGVLYVYISSADIVFMEKKHFNLGQNGLTYLVRPSPPHSLSSLPDLMIGWHRRRNTLVSGLRGLGYSLHPANVQTRQ